MELYKGTFTQDVWPEKIKSKTECIKPNDSEASGHLPHKVSKKDHISRSVQFLQQ